MKTEIYLWDEKNGPQAKQETKAERKSGNLKFLPLAKAMILESQKSSQLSPFLVNESSVFLNITSQ